MSQCTLLAPAFKMVLSLGKEKAYRNEDYSNLKVAEV